MTPQDQVEVDDDAVAAEMRDYLAFVCAGPDAGEYCAELAAAIAIQRMEDEGIA